MPEVTGARVCDPRAVLGRGMASLSPVFLSPKRALRRRQTVGRGPARPPTTHLPDHGCRDAGRVVPGATPFQSAQLPVERDRCSLGEVVPPAECLSVRDSCLTAATVRMNMVGLETSGLSAATEDPAVVFAATPRPRQDDVLVCTGEPSDRIAIAAGMSSGMDQPDTGDQQEDRDCESNPGR
jgi:hypothetical protein